MSADWLVIVQACRMGLQHLQTLFLRECDDFVLHILDPGLKDCWLMELWLEIELQRGAMVSA